MSAIRASAVVHSGRRALTIGIAALVFYQTRFLEKSEVRMTAFSDMDSGLIGDVRKCGH